MVFFSLITWRLFENLKIEKKTKMKRLIEVDILSKFFFLNFKKYYTKL